MLGSAPFSKKNCTNSFTFTIEGEIEVNNDFPFGNNLFKSIECLFFWSISYIFFIVSIGTTLWLFSSLISKTKESINNLLKSMPSNLTLGWDKISLNIFGQSCRKAKSKSLSPFSFLQLISSSTTFNNFLKISSRLDIIELNRAGSINDFFLSKLGWFRISSTNSISLLLIAFINLVSLGTGW